jgi:hypothetical protein
VQWNCSACPVAKDRLSVAYILPWLRRLYESGALLPCGSQDRLAVHRAVRCITGAALLDALGDPRRMVCIRAMAFSDQQSSEGGDGRKKSVQEPI